jgi:hypothetical protein
VNREQHYRSLVDIRRDLILVLIVSMKDIIQRPLTETYLDQNCHVVHRDGMIADVHRSNNHRLVEMKMFVVQLAN